MNEPKGTKKKIEELIKAHTGEQGLSLSEIVRAMGLTYQSNSEVSAALVKLVTRGQVLAKSGPSTSNLGPRWVKKYSWNQQRSRGAPPKAVKVEGVPRRVFNF